MLEAIRSSFFRNLFLTFFLLMNILLVGFSAALTGQWSRTRREKEVQKMHSQMELAVRMIDEKFSAVDLMASQIASGRWLKYVSARSDILYSRVDYEKKQEISQTIGNHNDSLRIARSTAVLLPLRNLAVDKVSFWEVERYFKSVGLSEKMMEEIAKQTREQYGSLILYTNADMQKDNTGFAIIRRLEYGQDSEKLLFVYVDGKQYASFLKNTMIELASLEIYYEGREIYGWHSGEKEEEAYSLELPSGLHNWTYRIAVNDSGYLGPGWKAGLLIIVAFLTFLLLELTVAWQLANFTVRPVRALMEKLGIGRAREAMLDAIEKSWMELTEQKEWMESQGNQYYEIAEAGYLTGLLFGNLEEEAALKYAKKFRFPFEAGMYAQALLFRYLGEHRRDFESAMLKLQILCTRDGVSAVFCREESVLLLTAQEKASVSRQEEKIRVMMDEMFPGLEFEMHSGEIHRGFEGLAKSCKESRERQDRAGMGGGLPYYYPLELEVRLIRSLRPGNFEETGEILKEIREENESRGVSDTEMERVAGMIREVLRRFAADVGLENEQLRHTLEKGREGAWWEPLLEGLGQIRKGYEGSGGNHQPGREIVAYVDAHFESSELSQQDIADIFKISRPMVSKLFKESARMNFIDYLHKRRVERAISYFEQGERDVIAVAQKVGYENEVTFKRAFVKHEGMTPREYVKRVKREYNRLGKERE